ncbi:FAD-dependent monooxygenase [Enteractinococcus coprophilus]|uniref:2-polyprenyl-6-methoxyphenol hydroxylase-like FAD-dependent oxidoreductase n=1 Tax=Enteractinococcus coprophilus TaxID=1027633 RepID=A0A543AG38_9MICC|nr:FAD-dependent monooxygenase [Enteractinococcus coprophilus]TQL71539.1 2-polyprenyl-6-methoxyphenol hydroxylase-like FAD-dependent oxidoreductase [Enteractinococcus coprophilus]
MRCYRSSEQLVEAERWTAGTLTFAPAAHILLTMVDSTASPDVLVVGAGPTGLTAALAAIQAGMTVRIIDQRIERTQYSKALVTHARTMEIFAALGIADDVAAAGRELKALNLRGSFGVRGRVALDELDWGDTAYPHWLIIPQFEVENLLEQALARHQVAVEWGTQLTGLQQSAASATAKVSTHDQPKTVTSSWVVGADGGHSTVRANIGSKFKRAEAEASFILADAYTTAHLPDREAQAVLAPEGFLLLIPLPTHGLWRIVAHLPYVSEDSAEPISPELLDGLIASRARIHFGAHDIEWTSRFSPSYGIASPLRSGRVFLAGDAAHVHSPVGGQGMNFGVHDAHNMMWKLALAHRLESKDAAKLLDSYESERRPVIERMVARVQRITTLVTDSRRAGRRVLGTAAPTLLPRTAARQFLGQTMAGLNIAYQHGPLVLGRDKLSGKRAASAITRHQPPGTWYWYTDNNAVQLIRPDGVVAVSGATRQEVNKRIDRNALLKTILDVVAPTS